MRVFISWSGERSKQVANLLDEWLVCVLQACRPWVSTKDIDKGSLWFTEISDQLRDTSVGIICLTQDNKSKPWILFEAGALAKGLLTARVCTLLVDLQPRDISDPLAQFNHALPDSDGIYALVKTINSTLGVSGLDPKVLDRVFETYWPQFEQRFQEILKSTSASQPESQPRESTDVLGEILEHTRMLNSRMRKLEADVRHGSQINDTVSVRRSGGYKLSAREARSRATELFEAGVDEDRKSVV